MKSGRRNANSYSLRPNLDGYSYIQQAQLWQALQSPPVEGGLWNGQKVANWMSELLGHRVYRQRGWEYLKAMKLRLRVPRPSHEEPDFVEQEEWKKKLVAQVTQVQKKHPKADVEVWTMGSIPIWQK